MSEASLDSSVEGDCVEVTLMNGEKSGVSFTGIFILDDDMVTFSAVVDFLMVGRNFNICAVRILRDPHYAYCIVVKDRQNEGLRQYLNERFSPANVAIHEKEGNMEIPFEPQEIFRY